MPHAVEPAARRLCAVLSIKVSGAKKSGEAKPNFPRPRQEGGSDFTKLCFKNAVLRSKNVCSLRECVLFLHMNGERCIYRKRRCSYARMHLSVDRSAPAGPRTGSSPRAITPWSPRRPRTPRGRPTRTCPPWLNVRNPGAGEN